MLVFAILGMPFVLAYMAVIYWVFRGKVQLLMVSQRDAAEEAMVGLP